MADNNIVVLRSRTHHPARTIQKHMNATQRTLASDALVARLEGHADPLVAEWKPVTILKNVGIALLLRTMETSTHALGRGFALTFARRLR